MNLFSPIKKPHNRKLLFLIPIPLLLAVLVFFYTQTQRDFHQFTDSLFESELTENTLTMHYTVANPDRFGIDHYEPVLPVFSPDDRKLQKETLESSLSRLRSLNPGRLNSTDSYTYSLLLSFFENEWEHSDCYYYNELLSPASGMQTQLPILLAEYTFRTKQDIEDYLSLLDQTDSYFSGLLAFEQAKADEGLFMSDTAAKKVISQCDSIMDSEKLQSGSHFLQTTFLERTAALEEEGILSREEADAYAAKNSALLENVMAPAYVELADGLFLLCGRGQNDGGLAGYELGKEYYLYLLKKDVGCYRDINEIKSLLCENFDRNLSSLVSQSAAAPELLKNSPDGGYDAALALTKPEEMLSFLLERMQPDFPKLKDSASHSLKLISESLADYCSPAFYLTPPLDDSLNNVIYLNPNNDSTSLNMFTTLAHEGYPGHLYQSVFYNQLPSSSRNPVRNLLWYSGYAEGWALYVEFLSYDYAAEIARREGKEDAAKYYELVKTDRQVQLCLYALLDVSIHYDGAGFETVQKLLNSMGISDKDTCRSIYEYIVEEPANYMKYYLGYLEILDLKKSAREKWGKDYSDYAFHEFYLEMGPSDFRTLRSHLER